MFIYAFLFIEASHDVYVAVSWHQNETFWKKYKIHGKQKQKIKSQKIIVIVNLGS